MSYTSPDLPGDPAIPDYHWVQKPDPKNYGSTSGCHGCAFRRMPEIRCSRIPCHRHPGFVAELVQTQKP